MGHCLGGNFGCLIFPQECSGECPGDFLGCISGSPDALHAEFYVLNMTLCSGYDLGQRG